MPAPEIKICGVSTPDALDAAIAARADHVGFVFFAASPRNVGPTQAAALAARAGERIGRVGLFVDADDAAIAQGVEAGRLTALQLHGAEPPERAAALASRFGLPVWKAIAVTAADDLARAEHYRGAADRILFDAKTNAALPGGMGLTFDWSLLGGWRGAMAWGLAGGLTPANVAEAVSATGAPMVDTSSGVESAPGAKDPALIAAFCAAARSGAAA